MARRLALICGLLLFIALLGIVYAVRRHPVTFSTPELESYLRGASRVDGTPTLSFRDNYGGMSESGTDFPFLKVGDPAPMAELVWGSHLPSPAPTVTSIEIRPGSTYVFKKSDAALTARFRSHILQDASWKIQFGVYEQISLVAEKQDPFGKCSYTLRMDTDSSGVTTVSIIDRVHTIPAWRFWVFKHLHF